MAVKTGYKKEELAEMSERLLADAQALVSTLQSETLDELRLVCCCDRCIDPPALRALCATPPSGWSRDLMSQYYGGAGAVGAAGGLAEQVEAWIVLVHTIALLAQGTTLSRDDQRAFMRNNHFIEPEHWTMNLIRSGVLENRPAADIERLATLLNDCALLASARDSSMLRDALTFSGLVEGALSKTLASIRALPPRKRLRFWTNFAGWIDHGPTLKRSITGIDLHRWYRAMPPEGREALLAALEDVDVARLIERYAYAAQDETWARYLSRLLEWREATILSTQWSDVTNETLMDRR